MNRRRLLEIGEGIFSALLLLLTLLLAPEPLAVFNSSASPEQTARPDTGVTVALDAGHGGFDGGAVGLESGVAEAGLNLKVAKLVKAELNKAGIQVIMTREDENALGSDKNSDMAARKKIISDDSIDLVVSIHMNKFSDRSVKGPMAFYMSGSESGQAFAECIINSVCSAIGHPPRFANPGDYFMIRVGSAPSVIIECGFLSNASDEALLQDAAHQQKLADGIAGGILAYIEQAGLGFSPSPAPFSQ